MKIEDYIRESLVQIVEENKLKGRRSTHGFTDFLLQSTEGRINLCYLEEMIQVLMVQPIGAPHFECLEIYSPGSGVMQLHKNNWFQNHLENSNFKLMLPTQFVVGSSTLKGILNPDDWENEEKDFFSRLKPGVSIDFREVVKQLELNKEKRNVINT